MSRPSFSPTEEQLQRVKALAGYGLSQEQIAAAMSIGSTATLRKHFRDELQRGPLEAQAKVRRSLFRMASSGRHPAATMFWLNTRAGWSEQGKVPEPPDAAREFVFEIHEYQPPGFEERKKQLEQARQGFERRGEQRVRWEGDLGALELEELEEEEEAPRRRPPRW